MPTNRCWYYDRTGTGKSDNAGVATACRDIYSTTIVPDYQSYTAPIGFAAGSNNDDLFLYICIVELANGDFIPGNTSLDSD